jgi:uncharacterized protein (TIGR04255 family)
VVDTLPSFRKPPLVEVAIGTTFSSGHPVLAHHLSLYWHSVASRFPHVQQQEPIVAQVERFGEKVRPSPRQLKLHLKTGATTPRLWLLNSDDSELVQIQSDMFLRNWRRYQSPDIEYPRFEEHLRPAFLSDYRTFEQFLDHKGVGPLKVDQLEVTYINHIAPPDEDRTELSEIIKLWNPTRDVIGELETFDVAFSKKLYSDDVSTPVGRLHVAMRTDWIEERPMLVLSLTVRGYMEHTEAFLDLAHREIVVGFTGMTTDAMHKLWERVQ